MQLKRRQQGMSLFNIVLLCFVLGFVAIIAAKVVPEVSEYMDILRAVKAVAADPASRGSVRDVKIAYSKRAEVAYIKSVTADDLEISKDGDEVVIDFAYTKKIPLFLNASLLLEFEGNSAP